MPIKNRTDEAKVRISITIRKKEMLRLKEMQRISELTLEQVMAQAFRIYEEALKLNSSALDKDGILYLAVKYPGGEIVWHQVFEQVKDS